MLKIDMQNTELDEVSVKKIEKALTEIPPFVAHNPDIEKIISDSMPFKDYDRYILIGNGGSMNNSVAMIESLSNLKKVAYITTMEPDYLHKVAIDFPKEGTLVIIVSKSGTTVGALESMLFFMHRDYKILAITNDHTGSLLEISKRREFPVLIHPEVGGRFSGRTSCAMVPAFLAGFDIDDFNKGCLSMYEQCKNLDSNNPALMIASRLYELENRGKVDVFMPIYSSRLFAFNQLIVQLMHESFGKARRGQSFFGGSAPETQHHTNQRFFGGRDNICGMFITVDNQDDKEMRIEIPDDLKSVPLRGGTIEDLSGVPYENALEYEFEGTYRDAIQNDLPVMKVSLDKITPFTLGEFMGFWQYVALYSSLLRDVNPYDQPQVESSKQLSFQMRLEHK